MDKQLHNFYKQYKEWAFRFLQSIPEVTMILSGMSNLEQIKQNIATFETEKPLDKTEMVLKNFFHFAQSSKTSPFGMRATIYQ